MSFWSTLSDIGKVVANPVGSIISGIIGSSAQNSANETNVALQRETNAQNYKMFQEQLGFTENMWNKANEYNTPANQRTRYEQAGINPYMALGAITGGNAQTASSPSPNPAVSPQVTPNMAMSSAMANMANGLPDSLLKSSQADNLNADTQTKNLNNLFIIQRQVSDLREQEQRINESLARQGLSKEETKNKRMERRMIRAQIRDKEIFLKYAEQEYKAKSDEQLERVNLVRNQARNESLKADFQEMTNEAFPQMNAAQLNVLSGQAFQAYKAGELSGNMSEREKVKKIGDIIDNGIKSGDFTLKQLGISSAELQALRDGRIVENLKGSKVSMWLDNVLYYTKQYLPNIGFIKGLK